jgi:hypothetical protein
MPFIRRDRSLSVLGFIAFVAVMSTAAAPPALAQGGPGTLVVKFFYDTPTNVEPTYHTAMWLEDKGGKLVKTLFVSSELSSKEYKMGNACPDWVKQARWEKAPKADVDAVTAPTPMVGVGDMAFDLATLKVAPGTYGFRFQVHVSEEYNLLYKGQVTVGGPGTAVKLELVTGPGKLDTTDQFVKDVEVLYVAGK